MFLRASDGMWIARVPARDEFGRATRIQVARKRKEDALAEFERLRGSRVAKGTVGEFLERWLHDVARRRVDEGTFAQYERDVRGRIAPHVGWIALAAFDPPKVAALYRLWASAGLGPAMARKAAGTLRNALETAVAWDLIRANPADAHRVPLPHYEPPERPTLDVDQARRLLELIAHDRLRPVYVLAISMGLRQGEIFGLQWEDLDLEHGLLTLRHSLQELSGRHRLKGLKRRRQRRELPLPAIALDALLDHRAAAEREERDVRSGYVFTSRRGTPLRKALFHRYSWNPLRAQLGLPAGVQLHFHDLRHTLGVLQRLLGADLETRRQQLGHASIATTAEVYGHALPETLRAAARAIDDLLRPAKKDSESARSGTAAKRERASADTPTRAEKRRRYAIRRRSGRRTD